MTWSGAKLGLAAVTREFSAAASRLGRRPGFAIGAAISLALGMALATVVFSMIDALFLTPLPYPEQNRLVHVYEAVPSSRGGISSISARHYLAIRSSAKSLVAIAASRFGTRPVTMGPRGNATRYRAVDVTTNYFGVLGTRPSLGRTFANEDARLGAAAPVIIAHSVWATRFGADPSVVGRAAEINGVPRVVIGVMPPGFDYPGGTQVWLPWSDDSLRAEAVPGHEGWPNYQAIGRLAPGGSLESATSEFEVIYQRSDGLAKVQPDRYRPRAVSLASHVTSEYRELINVWIAAAIVIAILCAVNFTTMSLARGMRRRGEIAVRSAMGATPRRVVAFLASEGALMALLGGVLSVVLAAWMLGVSRAWFGDLLPVAPVIGWRTVAFGIAATTTVGFLCALAPAIDLSKADLRSLISADASTATIGSRELRGRRGLVALQVALALACVAIVATLVQIDRRTDGRGPGYDYSSIVTADLNGQDSSARAGAIDLLREYVRSLPGTIGSTVVNAPVGFRTPALFLREGGRLEAGIGWVDVGPEYFATLGLHPVAGRFATAEEVRTHAPVAVLSVLSGSWLFGKRIDPIGRRLRIRPQGSRYPVWLTIIGIAPDVRFGPSFDPMSVPIYTQGAVPIALGQAKVLMRVRGDPQQQLHLLANALSSIDSRILVTDLRTVTSEVDDWRALSRSRTLFLTLIAVLALVLAVVGVYGLTAFTTEARAREIGIRIALGAPKASLTRSIIGDLLWMGGIGVIAGWLVSVRAADLLDTHLSDPAKPHLLVTPPVMPIAVAAAALIAITILGTFVPLRRVLRMDVMRAVQGG